jgi:transposase
MRKLVIANAQVMQRAVQQEIARSDEARYDHRLHGILLVCRGLTCSQVAEWLGQDPRTVQRWVRRFERGGLAGLREGDRPGRPPTLTPPQVTAANRALRRSPRALGYTHNLWDGKLLAHHLATVHGVALGVRQCQRLFRAWRFWRRKPRPIIAKADPAAQAALKNTPPARPRPAG